MPLFIDYHQFDSVTIEDVKAAHMADVAIQDEYGVKYHQFWVNEEAGTVFCLMEGPDMETCAMVHRMSHGNVACAITEVKEGIYKLAMGNTVKSKGGLVKHRTGEVDQGYRSMLVVSIRGITRAVNSSDLAQLLLPLRAKEIVLEKFREFQGREVPWAIDDSMIAVFDDPVHALQSARSIQQLLLQSTSKEPKTIFKMGLATGQPVTKNGDFFDTTLKLSHRLSNVAEDNQLVISSLVAKLTKLNGEPETNLMRMVSPSEERLLSNLFSVLESDFHDESLSIENLCRNIGMSRPQLYRKVKSITGRSPSMFLKDLRLDKAKTLLQQKSGNVTEVAMEVGYSNLSYFSRCFTEKFGFRPSAL